MSTVIGLLECAVTNIGNGSLGTALAKAQIKQYLNLKKKGVNDFDDVDEALEKYPDCELDIDLFK
ncbi:MAG: hypothetical protein ACOC22_01445 [bacterium]